MADGVLYFVILLFTCLFVPYLFIYLFEVMFNLDGV